MAQASRKKAGGGSADLAPAESALEFTPARFVDRGLSTTDENGKERDRMPRERFALPEVEESGAEFQPVLLYFYAQEDEKDAATRHPVCAKFEERIHARREVAEAAADFRRLSVNARKVPIPSLGLWRVSRAPSLVAVDHAGKIRAVWSDPATSPVTVAGVLNRIADEARAAKEKASR